MKDFTKSSGWKKFQNGFVRVAGKISGNRLLLTLRDTFVLVAATTMIAGFAIMIQNVIIDPMNGLIFGKQGLGLGKLIAGSWSNWEQSGFYYGFITILPKIILRSSCQIQFHQLLLKVFLH